MVPPDNPVNDSFVALGESLRELEIVIGERARPVIACVRKELQEATASRQRGDLPAALEKIRRAMERLAALASELDPAEGAMMREVARVFMRSLSFGEKGAAREAVEQMRRKAGKPKDADPADW
jgi:hypothetical protein